MAIPVFLFALIFAVLNREATAVGLDDSNSPGLPDTMLFLDNLQSRELGGNKLRELANMYEALALAREEAPEVVDELPLLPFQARLLQDQKDKRASYMSLCHFKICNMGRKRSYWNAWQRA